MDIAALLNDKSIKSTDKREQIANAIRAGEISVKDIRTAGFDEKKTGIILEAMESVSRDNSDVVDIEWLSYAEAYISSSSNSLKREAARVVGNIAGLFPDSLDDSIKMLIENTKNDGTVVRWGSAYALGRIILIPKYADSELFDVLTDLAERETESGVKNQYLGGLKKAKKLKK
ncbi:MAG: HEAT repeat domain-containing protein [Oscillospiraceae bacterium]|jgi:hypothetical protein|nr:HEAT repeat domain-containing protein [Oscillospiraceae bacterium]